MVKPSRAARLDRYAVMGNPISHSKSPEIHRAFAEQTGQPMSYGAIHVALGVFEAAVRRFQDEGGKGLNVTLPFKQEAYRVASQPSDRVHRAGAANTLWFAAKGKVHADNTDGIGLVQDILVNHRRPLRGQCILMLGAGGAARGVLAPLLAEKPTGVWVANRTVSKAEELAKLFADLGAVYPLGYERLGGKQFDLVINATSASLQGEIPPLPARLLAPGAWCYDMMYGDSDTPFLRWARSQRTEYAVDGLGMLVEQAASSFYLWRGIRPDTRPVIASLRCR